jgi:hypothetical protein
VDVEPPPVAVEHARVALARLGPDLGARAGEALGGVLGRADRVAERDDLDVADPDRPVGRQER